MFAAYITNGIYWTNKENKYIEKNSSNPIIAKANLLENRKKTLEIHLSELNHILNIEDSLIHHDKYLSEIKHKYRPNQSMMDAKKDARKELYRIIPELQVIRQHPSFLEHQNKIKEYMFKKFNPFHKIKE